MIDNSKQRLTREECWELLAAADGEELIEIADARLAAFDATASPAPASPTTKVNA